MRRDTENEGGASRVSADAASTSVRSPQAPEEGFEPPTRRLTVATAPEGGRSLQSARERQSPPSEATDGHGSITPSITPGRFRWIVFQARKSGPFRLTQNLWADHRSQATTLADALYEGCVGTLTVMSFAEYEAAQDDVAAIRRTRLAPKGEGEKRPYCRRGISYGACNYCGTITTANGGRAPDYCADHNSQTQQRAYCRQQRRLAQGVAS